MKKISLKMGWITIVVFGLILVMIFLSSYIFKEEKITETINQESISLNYHSWTKAVCNYEIKICVEMYIECNGNKLINMTPISESIYMGNYWVDPRSQEWLNRWC